MKTKMNFLKTAVMAMALMGAAQVSAQVPTGPSGKVTQPSDLNVGKVTFDGTTETFTVVSNLPGNDPAENVGFYLPTDVAMMTGPSVTSMTMHASAQDSNGESFVSFNWYEVSASGAETLIANTTADPNPSLNTYTFTDLTPGYHKFRVKGEVSVDNCESNEYEDMIVFVLPQLDVEPSSVSGTLTYCEDDVPTGSNAVELSAGTVTADYTGNTNGYSTPGTTDADADFALTYNWYAVPSGGTATHIGSANTATVDLTTLTGANPLQPDSYTFYVEVEYDTAIRDKARPDGTERSYVTYGGSTNVTTTPVVITKTPGTPTITVTDVTD